MPYNVEICVAGGDETVFVVKQVGRLFCGFVVKYHCTGLCTSCDDGTVLLLCTL